MTKVFKDRMLVAIDVGTTKICVIVSRQLSKENVEITGIGTAPSDGLKKGVVVDIGKTIKSIKSALKEAEIMSGMKIESAYVGISGGHIKSINSQGMIPIKKGEIREKDIHDVIDVAKAVKIPEGQQILHVLPQYFILDSKDIITNPLGMYAVRLEARVHIITGAIASVQNLIKCCEMAGVEVKDIVLEQLASADAVLSEDERLLGTAILDIGGGTSDLAIYQENSIRHTMVLPVAGNHFTNDLAIGLKTPLKEAERVKREINVLNSEKTTFEIESIEGKNNKIVKSSEINRIIKLRAKELLSLVYEEIISNNLENFISSGLVLTGGGSLLSGMTKMAEKIFKIPVRIGRPRLDEASYPEILDNPSYATGYGLIINAIRKKGDLNLERMDGTMFNKVLSRMKSWVYDFF